MTQNPPPAGPHPAEHELADLLDGLLDATSHKQVTAHVTECPVCRYLLDRAAPPLPPATLVRAIERSHWPQLPEQVQRRLVDGHVTEPAPGQVWRLRGPSTDGELAELAVIVRVDEELLVAPATADERAATDLWTVQLHLNDTGVPLAVWVSLSAAVGWEVLDVHLGSVDSDLLLRVHRALRRGEQPPRGLSTGRIPDEEVQAYRTQLSARMTALSESRLVSAVENDLARNGDDFEPAHPVSEGGDLVEALRDAGWDLGEVKEVLGVSASQARLVLERQRPLTPDQAARVREALGVSAAAPVLAPPARWVRELAAPARRRRFERVAAARGEDPWEFRAEQAWAQLAARGHRGAEPDWAQLVEQHLARLEAAAGLTPET